ncbi:hypothetical protein SeMB42_g06815 [Synchytrium endobioticum]|uniref:Uncharacterized protein n=1 Tax=Synchytrium endobioticum TaxID=286115 RepID=A0A507CEI5_9FUNG|nr:hypothetical protein SeMB42_g06815 [Synchytrium endobioticum]
MSATYQAAAEQIADFLIKYNAIKKPIVLTGAGYSTASGIPDYRVRRNAYQAWDNVGSLSALKSRTSRLSNSQSNKRNKKLQTEFMACAIMSKYLIIVLLLLALLHHGFADPEDTDAILKQQTEALRREKWAFRKSSIREKREKKLLSEVSRRLQNSPNEDPAVLISLVVQYIVDVGFTKNHVEPPHAGMSQAELEFRWEALDLADYLLPGGYSEYCTGLKEQYRQELTKRVADATFGSARALEYPADQIDWPSAIFLMVFEVQRSSKALESLKASNESPVSSFTEADVLLVTICLYRILTNTNTIRLLKSIAWEVAGPGLNLLGFMGHMNFMVNPNGQIPWNIWFIACKVAPVGRCH